MSNKLSLLVNFVGVDKMSGSLRSIMRLGDRGGRSLNQLRGEGRRLESQMRAVRRQIDNTSGNITGLIDQERRLQQQIDRTNREMAERRRLNAIEGDRRGMRARGDAMMNSGREQMAQGVTLAAPLILATREAALFSSGLVDIQQKAELTNAEADQLGRNIQVMARNAKRMPEEMRSGLDVLLAKGMNLEGAQAAIAPAGRLATAYKVEIPDAARAAYAAINNLKVPASETARIFDIMAQAGNEGAFEVRNMARHFPSLTAQLQALGEDGTDAVADLSAALQVAMHTAGSEDEAGNNIKNLLAKINAPATVRAFEKNFGVNLPRAMQRLTEAGYSSLEAITMVTEQATGGDMSRLGYAFEDMQARQGIMALMQNLEEYRRIRESAMNSGGTVDRAFGQRAARDATVNWTAFKASMSTLAITLGSTLLPIATQAMDMIAGIATRVGEWAQANPEAAATMMKLVAGLAVLKIGLGATTFLLGGFLKPLANIIAMSRRLGLASQAFTILRTAALFMARGVMRAGLMMLANPIVLAITAIVLAIAGAAYLIYSNWDKIKQTFAAGVQFLAGMGSRMMAIGRGIVTGLANGIRNAGSAVWNALRRIVMGGIDNVKSLLGINSPSRLFMQIGGFTGEGMALGIEGQRRRVGGAARSLAKGAAAAGAMSLAAPAMAGPAMAGQAGGQGGGITIHIHQQPGEDAQGLASRVADELERRQGRAARRRYEDGI